VDQHLAGDLEAAEAGYLAWIAAEGDHPVACCNLGAIALRRQRYDLVLMDVQMPEMDGLEAARRIAADWPTARRPVVVAMTAGAMKEDRDLCLAAGMDDYVSKPVHLEQLRATIERWGECISGRARKTAGPAAATTGRGPAVAPELPAALRELEDEGTPEVLAEVIDLFLASVPCTLADLQDAARRGDGRALKFAAHRLKGGSAAMSADRMAELCRELEAQADAALDGGTGDALAQLYAEFEVVQRDLLGMKRSLLVPCA